MDPKQTRRIRSSVRRGLVAAGAALVPLLLTRAALAQSCPGPLTTDGQPNQFPSVIGSDQTSSQFQNAAINVANSIGITPNCLMNIMSVETGAGQRFAPTALNPNSGATGLIQFMPSTANRMFGIGTYNLYVMDAVTQLNYVQAYFQADGFSANNPASCEQAYGAVGGPKGLQPNNPDQVLYAPGSGAISGNPGWVTYNSVAYPGQATVTQGSMANFLANGDCTSNPNPDFPYGSLDLYGADSWGSGTTDYQSNFDQGAAGYSSSATDAVGYSGYSDGYAYYGGGGGGGGGCDSLEMCEL